MIKYLKIQGRATRSEFWLVTIASIALMIAVAYLIFTVAAESNLGTIVINIVFLFCVWVSLAVQVRRWHDRDKSGFWVFINLIPIIGTLWALIENGFLPSKEGFNRF